MSEHVFGQIDQSPVFEVTIASRAGASAKILTYGAVVRDLIVPSSRGPQRVALGLNSLSDYLAYSPHFGAVPGRFANRIANGRFALDGVAYQLDRKPGDKHTLHGGPHGFGHRVWKLGAYDGASVELTLESPDGDAGFPGALTATCVYRLVEPATLRVELSAVSDRPTVVNLTNHTYFNLDGSPDILDHEVTLFADFYTPADAELIPTGEIRAVAGTPYDFRAARAGSQSDRNDLRHQFRRRPPTRRRRSCADCDGAFAAQRPDVELVQHRARRPVLRCRDPQLPGAGIGRRSITARTPAYASRRKPSRIRPTGGISPIACCGRTNSTGT